MELLLEADPVLVFFIPHCKASSNVSVEVFNFEFLPLESNLEGNALPETGRVTYQ